MKLLIIIKMGVFNMNTKPRSITCSQLIDILLLLSRLDIMEYYSMAELEQMSEEEADKLYQELLKEWEG